MSGVGDPLAALGVVAIAGEGLGDGVDEPGAVAGPVEGTWAGVGVAVTPSTEPAGVGDAGEPSPVDWPGVADGRGLSVAVGFGVGVGVGVGVGDGPFSVDPGRKQRAVPQVSGYAARSSAGGTCAVVKGSGAVLPGKVKPPLPSWVAISSARGACPPGAQAGASGFCPAAISAWRTSAVESGSEPDPAW